MKLSDLVEDKEGNITFNMKATKEEAEHLMQFAINFLVSTGFSAVIADEEEDMSQLSLWDSSGETAN